MVSRREQGITPVRSVRVPDAVWERAQQRAKEDGNTLTYALVQFLEGYGRREIDLPTIHRVWPS